MTGPVSDGLFPPCGAMNLQPSPFLTPLNMIQPSDFRMPAGYSLHFSPSLMMWCVACARSTRGDLEKPRFQVYSSSSQGMAWSAGGVLWLPCPPGPRGVLRQGRCPWHTQSAGDLFACQADASIMSLISFKFTCSLCSASEWLAGVWDVLHAPSISRLWSVFPEPSPVYLLQQIFQQVKHSGSLAHFSIAQSAWWTDSI